MEGAEQVCTCTNGDHYCRRGPGNSVWCGTCSGTLPLHRYLSTVGDIDLFQAIPATEAAAVLGRMKPSVNPREIMNLAHSLIRSVTGRIGEIVERPRGTPLDAGTEPGLILATEETEDFPSLALVLPPLPDAPPGSEIPAPSRTTPRPYVRIRPYDADSWSTIGPLNGTEWEDQLDAELHSRCEERERFGQPTDSIRFEVEVVTLTGEAFDALPEFVG